MGRYFILVDREPIEVDVLTWGRQSSERGRTVDGDEVDPWRVAETRWEDGAWVSTVFLGLDHSWWEGGPPLIFESMLFGDPDCNGEEEDMTRCSTWDQALVMHRQMVVRAVEKHGQPIYSKLVGVL